MIRRVLAVAAAALLIAAAPTLRPLRPADVAILAQARAAARADRIANAEIFRGQSFRVLNGQRRIGTLVSGGGRMLRSDGLDTYGCFVALVTAGAPTQVVRTVGHGEWEAETCLGVRAVAVLADRRGGPGRLAVVHGASSPNAEAIETVILRWSGDGLRIAVDEQASRRVSEAGAQSVAAARAALAGD